MRGNLVVVLFVAVLLLAGAGIIWLRPDGVGPKKTTTAETSRRTGLEDSDVARGKHGPVPDAERAANENPTVVADKNGASEVQAEGAVGAQSTAPANGIVQKGLNWRMAFLCRQSPWGNQLLPHVTHPSAFNTSPQGPTGQRASFVVRVKDTQGKAVQGASVFPVAIVPEDHPIASSREKTTDKEGRVLFENPNTSVTAVLVTDSDYYEPPSHSAFAPVLAPIPEGGNDLVVTVPRPTRLQVRVTVNGQSAQSLPVTAALVNDKGVCWLSAVQETNPGGMADFPGLPGGNVRIFATDTWPAEHAMEKDYMPVGNAFSADPMFCLRGSASTIAGQTALVELSLPSAFGEVPLVVDTWEKQFLWSVSYISYHEDTGTFVSATIDPERWGEEVRLGPCFNGPLLVRAAVCQDCRGNPPETVSLFYRFDTRKMGGRPFQMSLVRAKATVDVNAVRPESLFVDGRGGSGPAMFSLVPIQYLTHDKPWSCQFVPLQYIGLSASAPLGTDGKVHFASVPKGSYKLVCTAPSEGRQDNNFYVPPASEVVVPEEGNVSVTLESGKTP